MPLGPRSVTSALLLLAGLLLPACALSQSDAPAHGAWGDQGDGSYINPILPADFSDIDAIRVGYIFYAMSSTFQYSPGVAILASHDLVNWNILGHVVPDLTRITPELGWRRRNREGRGIWAGAIRRHAGRYWIYFGTPDEGIFLSTARDPAGPWTAVSRVLAAAGWDDPCPFWDDDGKAYLVATHFAPDVHHIPYTIHLFRLSHDGRRILPGSDRVIHHSQGSEANKLYKSHGLYYHYYSEVKPEGRVAMMERARSLAGPWQTHQLIHVRPSVDKEPNQGGLLQTEEGTWYFLTHQGTGDWEGRATVLLPVTWIDGWPILGRPGADGIGAMLWSGKKPVSGFPLTSPAASDEFDSPSLRPEWEWLYQPRAESWSLTAHPGFLRLYADATDGRAGLLAADTVLTQRAMRTRSNQVTVKLDLAGLVDGQQAGLAHYAHTQAKLICAQHGTERRLLLWEPAGPDVSPAIEYVGPAIPGAVLWLRSTWNFNGLSQFSYSFDGVNFIDIGSKYQLTWGHYRGDRIAIFTSNELGPHGYLDVDSFTYQVAR